MEGINDHTVLVRSLQMKQVARQKTQERQEIQNGSVPTSVSHAALNGNYALQEGRVTVLVALPKQDREDDVGNAAVDEAVRVEGGAILALQAFQELHHLQLDLLRQDVLAQTKFSQNLQRHLALLLPLFS